MAPADTHTDLTYWRDKRRDKRYIIDQLVNYHGYHIDTFTDKNKYTKPELIYTLLNSLDAPVTISRGPKGFRVRKKKQVIKEKKSKGDAGATSEVKRGRGRPKADVAAKGEAAAQAHAKSVANARRGVQEQVDVIESRRGRAVFPEQGVASTLSTGFIET